MITAEAFVPAVPMELLPGCIKRDSVFIAKPVFTPRQSVRHDWSAFIGLLLLLGGITLLLLCILVIPYAGLPVVATILLELFLLYFVWRAIGTGATFLITRYRRKRNFGEK
jgi:hypothetical protein